MPGSWGASLAPQPGQVSPKAHLPRFPTGSEMKVWSAGGKSEMEEEEGVVSTGMPGGARDLADLSHEKA